ncbi:MAG: MFS transporter [Betaproteobacteria bacterium]
MTALLLNVGHAIDHLLLLVFATAVGAIAADFGLESWQSLMPFATGAFFMFGLGSLPAGRLGDLWGRRAMMLVFFFGIGASSIAVAFSKGPWSLAITLTLVGTFASIYHPVGIPMLIQSTRTPGRTIGINGLAGNLGIAVAAILTGFLVELAGWRTAFIVPGLISIVCGLFFLRIAAAETEPPAKRAPKLLEMSDSVRRRVLAVMLMTAMTGSLVFNLTTNGNPELLKDRLPALAAQPALMGALLAVVYSIASAAQLVVGRMIDALPMRPLMIGIIATQPIAFAVASFAEGWVMFAAMTLFMLLVFGGIPFSDAIVARYIDDRMRSRVSGMRTAISYTVGSAAVWLLGPFVKHSGFTTLLLMLAAITTCSAAFATLLPREAPAARQPD